MILEQVAAQTKRSTAQVDMPSFTRLHKPRQLQGTWRWQHDERVLQWPNSHAQPLTHKHS